MKKRFSHAAIAHWSIVVFSVAFFSLFLALPMATVFTGGLGGNPKDLFELLSLLFSSPLFYRRLCNSLNLALIATALSIAISFPLAYCTARYRFPGRSFFKTALLLPMILPPFVGAIGIRKLFSRFGPVNLALMRLHWIDTPLDWLGAGGLLGIAIVQGLHLYPILYLNLSAALSRVDVTLEEAAASLGASPWIVFRRVVLPILMPALIAGSSIVFIWSLTDLGTPLVFDYRKLLAVQIYEQTNEIATNPVGYVLVAVMTLLCLVLFAISQRSSKKYNRSTSSKGAHTTELRSLSRRDEVIVFCLFTLFLSLAAIPHASVILSSVASSWFMSIAPQAFSIDAYTGLLSHPLTVTSMKNSLELSSASTAIDLALGLAISWLLVRGTRRGRRLLDTLTMTPLAIPGIVVAYGSLGVFSGTILDARVNPMPLLIFGYALRRLPFMVRALEAGLRRCDIALEEAAASLGASPRKVMQKIVAPLLLPHILAGTILCFCFAMLEVSESLILALQERYYPITKAMYALLARPDGPTIACALGVVSMAVIVGGLFAIRKILGSSWEDIFTR